MVYSLLGVVEVRWSTHILGVGEDKWSTNVLGVGEGRWSTHPHFVGPGVPSLWFKPLLLPHLLKQCSFVPSLMNLIAQRCSVFKLRLYTKPKGCSILDFLLDNMCSNWRLTTCTSSNNRDSHWYQLCSSLSRSFPSFLWIFTHTRIS